MSDSMDDATSVDGTSLDGANTADGAASDDATDDVSRPVLTGEQARAVASATASLQIDGEPVTEAQVEQLRRLASGQIDFDTFRDRTGA